MKKAVIIIFLLASFILLSACAQEEAAPTRTSYNRNVELKAEPVVKELEVMYVNEQFFPDTFFVNEGEHVRLFLKNTENIFVTMPELRVNEMINHGYIEFEADKKGSFQFYCQDCEEPAIGMIHVV